jgi:hypothetical protein
MTKDNYECAVKGTPECKHDSEDVDVSYPPRECAECEEERIIAEQEAEADKDEKNKT